MHAKTDSEATSLAASSPPRAAYYVQSPSHDDGKTAATSVHSSPSASPRHSSSHLSSSTRYSAHLKHSKVSPAAHGPDARAIEEEGLLDDDDGPRPLPRRLYYLLFLLAFLLLFSFFSLVLWGASRAQRPRVAVTSVAFSVLNVQAGSDATGVPTDMADVNCTVAFSFRNTATFFGLHVTASPLELRYSEIILAAGDMGYFYQGRKSQRSLKVAVSGTRVPLYGSGSYLRSSPGIGQQPLVPLTLQFRMRSRAYVLGTLVKPKFYTDVHCSVLLDLAKLTKPIPLAKQCQID